MIHHTQRMIAIGLMAATMGAVSSCHSEEAQPLTLATHALPAASPQPTFPPSSLVGTVPISGSDQRAITPTETVGASSD